VSRSGGADLAIQCVAFPRAKFRHAFRTQDIASLGANRRQELNCEKEVIVPSEEVNASDYLHSMEFRQHAPEAYCMVARRVRNLESGQSFGFVIE